MRPSSLETHCIAAIGVVGAAIAAIHPGFHLPANTSQIVVGVFSSGAVLIEAIHRFFKSSLAVKLHLAEQAFASVQTVLEVPGTTATSVALNQSPMLVLPATHTINVSSVPPVAEVAAPTTELPVQTA